MGSQKFCDGPLTKAGVGGFRFSRWKIMLTRRSLICVLGNLRYVFLRTKVLLNDITHFLLHKIN